MEQLQDLDDGIIADDWLIPRHEINSKRLLKTTPKHTIYKADWFGDVLVYEPIKSSKCKTPQTTWSDLNELRLIAHESFLLFMGASIESDAVFGEGSQSTTTTALVMEMAHARSVQLSKLLHEQLPSLSGCRCQQQSSSSLASSQYSSGNVSPLSSCSPSPSAGSSAPFADRFNWALNERLRNFEFQRYSNLSPRTCSNQFNRSQQSHRYLHNKSDSPARRQIRLDTEAKLNICQQVTNAMTYLHNKNIVHGKLTSVNIYIEQNQRVKISLIDNDEQGLIVPNTKQVDPQSSTSSAEDGCTELGASFNRAALAYLSPELVKSIRLTTRKDFGDDLCSGNQAQNEQRKRCNETVVDIDTSRLTKAADIYSFGTLMFELFTEQYPFSEHTCTNSALQSPTAATSSAQRSMTSTPDSGCRTGSLQSQMQSMPLPFVAPPVKSSTLPGRVFFDDTMIVSDKIAQFTQQSPLLNQSPLQSCLRQYQSQHTYNNCTQINSTIKASACELIYQIGSGLIGAKNLQNKSAHSQSYIPALVKNYISSCWSYEAEKRPQFKDLSFT